MRTGPRGLDAGRGLHTAVGEPGDRPPLLDEHRDELLDRASATGDD